MVATPNIFRTLVLFPSGECWAVAQDRRRTRNYIVGKSSRIIAPADVQRWARLLGANIIVRVKTLK